MSGRYTMPSMHYHLSYELYYLHSGERQYFVGDKFFSVSAGSFVLVPSLKFHRTGGSYGERTLVGFSPEFLNEAFSPDTVSVLLKCFDKTLITVPKHKTKRFESLLDHIKNADSKTEFAIYLGVLLTELSKCDEQKNYDERVSKIIKYINENFGELNSVKQISDHFFISKYHLCHSFKSIMGVTVIDYLNSIKIKNACDLLVSGEKNMLHISQLCGFNSSSYFCKVFKSIMGVSPTQYKKHPEL